MTHKTVSIVGALVFLLGMAVAGWIAGGHASEHGSVQPRFISAYEKFPTGLGVWGITRVEQKSTAVTGGT